MSVGSIFRSSSEERPDEAAVRERRVEVARRNHLWTELTETDLVPRARYLVHAETDELFTLYRGVVFQTGSSTLIADRTSMHFYVDRDGGLVFLKHQAGSWSELIERKARRARR